MTDWLNKCHFGDVRDVLRQMVADGVKVNTIVTSPPYWGLRSYLPAGHADKAFEIGSEPTLREFISTMTDVMMLARDVLADDGTMWMNMGDSYAGSGRGGNSAAITGAGKDASKRTADIVSDAQRMFCPGVLGGRLPDGLKSKDLIGQPWRLAFALQDAGWWLRQDIVWSKPNPMPESVTDRCTKSHEYIFLMSKSERYYFDQEAILEPVSANTHARLSQNVQAQIGSDRINQSGQVKTNGTMKAVGRAPGNGVGFGHGTDAEQRDRGRIKNNDSFDEAMAIMPTKRNKRTVWTVATEPYKGSHYATYPRKLIQPCILAGCPQGGVVLDLFMGSGTTAQVAEQLGRQWIGIDIDVRNKALQDKRLRQPSLNLEAFA
jgi:DNA modification methylase